MKNESGVKIIIPSIMEDYYYKSDKIFQYEQEYHGKLRLSHGKLCSHHVLLR